MKYRTILIDPPWKTPWEHGNEETMFRGNPRRHYPTMSLEEIAVLPIRERADDAGCQLWIWTVNVYLHATFHLLEGWGFEHRATATWDKRKIGLGSWLRGQTEFLLLATRGNARTKFGIHGQEGSAWSDLIVETRREHSRKPGKAYEMIEALSEAPRIEFFARDRREGWGWYGNQLSSTIQTKLIEAKEEYVEMIGKRLGALAKTPVLGAF